MQYVDSRTASCQRLPVPDANLVDQGPLSPSPEPLKPRPGENPPDEIVIEGKPLKLGKRLGRGAFGVAYAVDWPGHGAAVAKTYHKTTHPRAIRKEIEQLKAVKQFLATGKVGDDTWVIMPLAPGVPLLKTRLYKEARKKSMEACKEFMTQARRIIATEEIRIRDQSDPHMLHRYVHPPPLSLKLTSKIVNSDVKLDNVRYDVGTQPLCGTVSHRAFNTIGQLHGGRQQVGSASL